MAITMKQARIGANMTIEDVARHMDVHPQTYSSWEKNPENMSIKRAFQFAELVCVPLDDIIFMPINSN